MAGWIKRQFTVITGERERAVNRDGKTDGCVELLFTSINSRVIALIADVNNSKLLVGNSLWEEPVCDNLSHPLMLLLATS